jgi:peptide/nickel transport system permease protein
MLSEGASLLMKAPWVATFPGIFIVITALGFNLLGDGLRDLLDPKLKV